jgi:2-iminobutanoate/2-iminopropanoate deaminase
MLDITNTDKAPAAIGPYSQAVGAGGFLFTSGQIPLDPASGEVTGGDITAQAEQAVKNLKAILDANRIGFDRVIKTTCFLADMGDFAAFNRVYERHFISKPARSCVAVKQLPRNVLCEIEAVALL